MKKSSYQSEIIFNMNERLFLNSLAEITEQQAKQRISTHSNPLIWIAAHTVWARYNVSMLLGNLNVNPYNNLFEGFKPFEEAMKFPSLKEVKTEWEKSSDLLKKTFSIVTEDQLKVESPIKSPIGDSTLDGTITFLAQHESYNIGQMAFLKKFLTKEAMRYN